MICSDCKEANHHEDEEVRKEWHAKCKGKTHCDCQHRIGPTEQFVQPQYLDDDNDTIVVRSVN